MKPVARKRAEKEFGIPNRILPKSLMGASRSQASVDTSVQGILAPSAMPPTFQNFEGAPNNCGCLPPDTNGDVGPNHYVQTVNVDYQVFEKDGDSLFGPININTLWQGFGGACEDQNDGDPIVLYDHLADRWLISQFAIFAADGNHHQCVAVSTSGDPTDTFHLYDFIASTTKINDYPKLGVWPDGYYMTVNQFDENTFGFVGAGVYAFERDQMLNGNAAQKIFFDLFPVNSSFGGMLPSDLDGPPPPVGTPNVFAEVDDESVFGTDRISLWDFHVDWVTPANSTFGNSGNPSITLDTAPFDWDMCGFNRSCIPQPGTGVGLDAISDRLMHRLQYRDFGSHASLVTNHTVDADGNDHAGVRWYELRDDGSGWTIQQQGTYAPDSDHRWMGSVAMDSAGNIAVGYSVSSSTTFPSIRYAGRLVGDPPDLLSQGEAEIIAGTGNQTSGFSRWGDYSGMVVDPTVGSNGGIDCDFWYTTEYIETSGSANWQTRVGAFSFAPGACGGPHGILEGTITDSATTNPIAGATVEVQPLGYTTTTDASGHYQFVLSVGTYDLNASAYGYFSQSATGLSVTDGGTTTQDFALIQAPVETVSGTVTDNSGHGWPLYARIDITGYPFGPVFTNPETGGYSVQLVQSTDYTFHVNAVSTGYESESRPVTPPPGGSTENFQLNVSPDCSAPGYGITGGVFETFESGVEPAGWTQVDNAGTDEIWEFDDPAGRGNLTGGSGGFAIVDSDNYGPSGFQDVELRTPVLDFSSQINVMLEFDTDYVSLGDQADVDVSTDGGSTWTNVWSFTSDVNGHQSVDISALADGEPDVVVRFHYFNAFWAWWWEVDNVHIGNTSCGPLSGGLLVGNTYDLNTALTLNAVTVTSDGEPSENTISFSTPEDDGLDDGFYILFSSLTGAQNFTATKKDYGPDTQGPTVVADSVVRQDFHLGSGNLDADPDLLEQTVDMGDTVTVPLTIYNNGTAAADFELVEREGLTSAPNRTTARKAASAKQTNRKERMERRYQTPTRQSRTSKSKEDPKDEGKENKQRIEVSGVNASNARDMKRPPAKAQNLLAAGDVLQTWDPGFFAWGVAFDGATGTVWVDSPGPGWGGDDNIVEFATDGTATGNSWPHSWGPPFGPADAAYNHNTGMLWSMDVGGDDCIHEIDPANGDTGNSICPGWGTSQRGIAYDPVTDTYYGGGWNEFIVYHFDGAGNILDQTDVGLAISGLAFNPETQHLFVMVNDSPNNIHVLDVANNYSEVGEFSVSGFDDFAGAGLEIDCDGNLWAVNQSENLVYKIDSGETASHCFQDVPWLSEDPTSGTVLDGENQVVDVTFDATVIGQPGDYTASLKVKENTPYTVPDVQVIMHVPVPPDWGQLAGQVTGLERCDAPGSPLNKATVFVDTEGVDYTLKTDSNGNYHVFFLASDSPAEITVSSNGYITQVRSGVVVNAQQTTNSNFDLRLDAPCADKSPTSFDVTLSSGSSATLPLTLSNTGAAGMSYTIRETLFPLPQKVRKPFPARAPYKIQGVGIGPKSVRSLKDQAGSKAPQSPSSIWFFGVPVPGGLVRYAHAQCDTLPNSFYLISGVDGSFSLTDKTWRYDADSNSWTELAPIPTAVEGSSAACYQGKIYVMGGSSDGSSGSTQMYIYHVAQNSWSSGADLPRPVWGAVAGAWNEQVFLIGGDLDFFGSGTSDEVDVYDVVNDVWVGTATSMPFATTTPGFVQAGPDIFMAGGWDSFSAPFNNVNATQRYDMTNDVWTTGPEFTSARSDFALAMTDTALYAIGGDEDGGGFFDATTTVERLDYTNWPNGSWDDLGDPLPVPQTANNGGFCTEAIHLFGSVSEVWSSGGVDNNFFITGNNAFRGTPEHCYTIFSDVPWLSESPTSGSVDGDDNEIVDVTFNAAGLSNGDYNAVLVVSTDDSGAPQFNIPVTLHVGICTFCDEFDDGLLAPDWTYNQTWTESADVLSTTTSKLATAIADPAFGGCQNCSMATSVSMSGGARVWVYAWWIDKNNVIELLFKEFNDKVLIKQRVGGQVVKKQKANVVLDPNTPYTATMTYDGTEIVVNVGGADVITFTPAGAVPSGTIGFGVKNGSASFEYIHVF